MITIKDIIEYSNDHPHTYMNGGKQTIIGNDKIEFSIIGGSPGLYGDFKDTFEVAIFDKQTGEFRTQFFHPEAGDDVIAYMDGKDVEVLVNSLIKGRDFQVR
jgi:hypothetical protein